MKKLKKLFKRKHKHKWIPVGEPLDSKRKQYFCWLICLKCFSITLQEFKRIAPKEI